MRSKNKLLCVLTAGFLLVAAACGTQEGGTGESSAPVVRIEGGGKSVTLVLGEEEYSSEESPLKAYAGESPIEIEYSSSDESVVRAENGIFRATGKGCAEVTAKAGGLTERIRVEVLERAEDPSVTDQSCVRRFGRTYEENGRLRFTNTAGGFEVSFIGTSLTAGLSAFGGSEKGALKVFVDGVETSRVSFPVYASSFTLAEGLEEGIHTVAVRKMTEQGYFKTELSDLTSDGCFLTARAEKDLKFEFYGDSITSGYGNLGNGSGYQVDEDGTQTYASMLAETFDAEYSVVSYAGVPACLRSPNATFTMLDIYDKVDASCGLAYDFSGYDADVVFVNLGTNDANNEEKTPEAMCEGYAELLRGIRSKRPDALVLCVYGMMGIDPVIEQGIARAVELLTGTEGQSDIYYLSLESDTSGRDGHPVAGLGHKNAAETIADYLRGRELLK